MKEEVTILDSTCSADEDESIFIFFMASKSIKDPPTTTSRSSKFFEDNYDELLDTYNELFWEHIKFTK